MFHREVFLFAPFHRGTKITNQKKTLQPSEISCQVCVFIPNTEALVLHYSEEEEGAGAAGAAAFLCTTNRGKLLQHKLIHVQCIKKGTRVPISPVPQYGYSV